MLIQIISMLRCRRPGNSSIKPLSTNISTNPSLNLNPNLSTKEGAHHPRALPVAVRRRQPGRVERRGAAAAAGAQRLFPRSRQRARRGGSSSG